MLKAWVPRQSASFLTATLNPIPTEHIEVKSQSSWQIGRKIVSQLADWRWTQSHLIGTARPKVAIRVGRWSVRLLAASGESHAWLVCTLGIANQVHGLQFLAKAVANLSVCGDNVLSVSSALLS